MSILASQRTSLYVGDLPTDLPNPEDSISGLFNSVAPVVSLKVCRDMNTQKSLGYAYVNFQNGNDAEKALDALNFTEIVPGREIRVMFSIRDPIIRKSGTNNLFIKKLDPSTTAKLLHNTFSAYGRVLSSKIALNSEGKSKCYGFVQFETSDGAKAGLTMNGKKLGDAEIVVEQYVRKSEREAEQEKTFRKIYVKNLKPSVSGDTVEKAFEKYGPIESIFVSAHPQHDTQFALITFTEHSAAVEAIEKLNGSTDATFADGETPLAVCRALKKSERNRMKRKATALYQNQGRNLYIKHLPESVTKEELEKLFSPFGKITSSAVMRDPSSGVFRGFAFVCFDQKESAVAAMHEMSGKVLPESRLPLYVSLAEQKDMRLRFLQQSHASMNHQQHMGPPAGMFSQPWPRQYPMIPPMYGGMGMPPQFMPGPVPQPMRRPMLPMQPQQRNMAMHSRYTQPRLQPVTTTNNNRHVVSGSGLDPAHLAAMSPEERMNVLGETLYNRILETNPQLAAKITGMLLEMGTAEILEVLEDNNALMSKVNEAISVLQQHSGN